MRIGAFMISCPERIAMREQTLRNLGATDWNDAAIVLQEQGAYGRKQDRQTYNSLCALRAGHASGLDFILFLEDDLDFNRHLRHNLESWFPLASSRPGGHFFASLYNPNIGARERRPHHHSFVADPESVYGSQAYILSHETAGYIIEHWEEVLGMQDIKMSRLAGRVCDINYSSPSLVQHIGIGSVWGGHYHQAADFDRDWRFGAMSQPYDREFFLNLRGSSLQAARVVIPLVLDILKPRRAIDVGCASGAWLAALRENGVEDVWGIDGDYLDADLLLVPPERILRRDLAANWKVDFQSDLVISLEVAEHLPSSSAAGFVASLAALGPVILFSAAIPGQGGYCHINEQWPEYWARFFAALGYVGVDCIRPQIWNNPTVSFWYRQNILLYVRETCIPAYPRLAERASVLPLALVHPDLYLMKCR